MESEIPRGSEVSGLFRESRSRSMEKNLFPIGRVVKPHGVKGKMKVEYFGDDLRRFFSYREIFIRNETGGLESYEILEVVTQPPRLILRLRGVEKIEETEPLL